jgi:hypothetical protein
VRTNVRFFLLLFAIMGCSASEGGSGALPGQKVDKARPPAAIQASELQVPGRIGASAGVAGAVTPGQDAATVVSECMQSALNRSRCMIEAVLQDIKATYPLTGGGGISNLRLVATDTYAVSIAQEERLDVITYTLELDDRGQVVIRKRVEGAKSGGP